MKRTLILAAAFALVSGAALAQGNSPYNSSGPQAGGPRGGMAREMGASGGTPTMGGAPAAARPMMKRRHHGRKMHRRHRM
ncbi:hypothetical protein [Methylobacterium sp. A54F]